MDKAKAPTKVSAKAKAPAKKAAPKVKKSAPKAHGVGRRKSAVARVWLTKGTGSLTVNKRDYGVYFDTEITRQSARLPFEVTPLASQYDVHVNVAGGGVNAQADAVKLGIARALLSAHEDLKPLLRENGLLTVDSRLKERKKYGQKGARGKFQFVKR